ncbi:acyltransferase [Thaumasiovibrio sp. DFM-14]|uniref:acyltransferase n=1 Tax=Thaumasiovibrio sp. DFM-14 TaxID=3384792 RepID=UPI0039A0F148
MSPSNSNKIASLELGRALSMFAIVILHCHILYQGPLINETPWLAYTVNQLARFGVPFFFILAGYLVQPKLTNSPFATLLNYGRPLMRIWLVWSLICLTIPFNIEVALTHGYFAERQGFWGWLLQTPINTMMEGGLVHLWYIPGLLCGLAVITIALHFKRLGLLWLVALGLYLFGVAGGSYLTLTELWTPFFTRNGPFFSTLMILLGVEIRRKSIRLSLMQSLMLAALGLVIHFSEAFWLYGYDIPFNIHDFLLGTPLWGAGIFMMLLSRPTFGDHPITFKLANRVLGVYVAHLPIFLIMLNLSTTFGIEGYLKDLFVVAATFSISLLVVEGILRTPLKRWLLR